MRSRPVQDIRIWSVQVRRAKNKPYSTRWVVDGRPHSRAFRTRAETDRYRSRLLVAQHDGEPFSARTGEPDSWNPTGGDLMVYAWAREWVAEAWREWSPRTRDSEIEALARFVPLTVDASAGVAPAGLRAHLTVALRHDAHVDQDSECERWLERWCLSLNELDERTLADADRQLGIGDRGQTLAANTAGRYRRVAHSCITRAVELKLIPTDPWPPARKGRSTRKSRRRSKAIDVKRLPDPRTMAALIVAMRNHQPASRMYQVMTAVGYFAGLRPSEIVMLRPDVLDLPADGWGRIDVIDADDGYDEPADPKTGPRPVPIPEVLVEILQTWLSDNDGKQRRGLLFRTRGDRRPTLSNWGRALKRASRIVGSEPITPYDCRHACATTWLGAGVPLGEAALRLGHSVETLVAYYIGALKGDDLIANDLIAKALSTVSLDIVERRP